MALTDIQFKEVEQAATNIRTYAGSMRGIFEDLISTMNIIGTDKVFAGKASNELIRNFTTIKSKFDSYTSAVESFATEITSAKTTLEGTDNKLATGASNLPG